MKKILLVMSLALVMACTNDGAQTEQKLDSLERKIDTTLERASDSLKVKAAVLRNKVRNKWRDAKDSLSKKDSVKF